MRRPAATGQALSFSPLIEAGGADSSRVERVPFMAAGAKPFVFFAGRPAAERATDAWAGWVAVLPNVAIQHSRRIVRDRTHARYYDLRPEPRGSVRRSQLRP